ncbi:hypothetical protein JCM16303_004798, partial [Sporobolomyces ruberrimus]
MPFNNGRRSSSSERESSLTRSQPPRLSNLDEESTLESPSQPPPRSLATSPLPLSQQPTYPILPQPKIPLDSDTDADESSSTSWTINMRDRTERGRSTRPKRKHTLSMSGNNKNQRGYGTILNESTKTVIGRRNDSLEGRPLLRQESVLKVAGLIDDRAGEFEKYRVSSEALKRMSKGLRKFYEGQNEILDGFQEVDEILDNARAKAATGELTPLITTNTSAKEEQLASSVKFAINLNFIVNVVLLIAKIGVVFISHSMSLIASTVDSAMDFLSTLIIFGTSRFIEHKDWKSKYIYPTGKSRMEPLGVLVFSVFMISSFLQVFIESIQRIMDKDLVEQPLGYVALGVMGATILIK